MEASKTFALHKAEKAGKNSPQKPGKISPLERLMEFQIITAGLPKPAREHQFFSDRRWRFDFAFPSILLALEVEGGSWMAKGGHTTGKGFEEDCEKYSVAACLGWRIIRATSGQVKSGQALIWLKMALARQEAFSHG